MNHFDGGIFAFFDLFPKRAHVTEPFDDAGQDFEDVIDVLHGVFVGKADPEGAVGDLMNKADGKQNVARIQRTGGAGGTGACTDAHGVQAQQKAFALDALDGNVDVAREPLFAVTVQSGALDFQDVIDELVAEHFRLFASGFDIGGGDFKSFRKADDGGYVSVPARLPFS